MCIKVEVSICFYMYSLYVYVFNCMFLYIKVLWNIGNPLYFKKNILKEAIKNISKDEIFPIEITEDIKVPLKRQNQVLFYLTKNINIYFFTKKEKTIEINFYFIK